MSRDQNNVSGKKVSPHELKCSSDGIEKSQANSNHMRSIIDRVPSTPHDSIIGSKEKYPVANTTYASCQITTLPVHRTPPSRNEKLVVSNPFEASLRERLHLPVFSPSVFAKTPPQDLHQFSWTIDDIALLQPAPIEEFNIIHIEEPVDPEAEFQAQEKIKRFFQKTLVVPSPWGDKSCVKSPFPIMIEGTVCHTPEVNKMMYNKCVNMSIDFQQKCTNEASSQTCLSLPFTLPSDVEALLNNHSLFPEIHASSTPAESLCHTKLVAKVTTGLSPYTSSPVCHQRFEFQFTSSQKSKSALCSRSSYVQTVLSVPVESPLDFKEQLKPYIITSKQSNTDVDKDEVTNTSMLRRKLFAMSQNSDDDDDATENNIEFFSPAQSGLVLKLKKNEHIHITPQIKDRNHGTPLPGELLSPIDLSPIIHSHRRTKSISRLDFSKMDPSPDNSIQSIGDQDNRSNLDMSYQSNYSRVAQEETPKRQQIKNIIARKICDMESDYEKCHKDGTDASKSIFTISDVNMSCDNYDTGYQTGISYDATSSNYMTFTPDKKVTQNYWKTLNHNSDMSVSFFNNEEKSNIEFSNNDQSLWKPTSCHIISSTPTKSTA